MGAWVYTCMGAYIHGCIRHGCDAFTAATPTPPPAPDVRRVLWRYEQGLPLEGTRITVQMITPGIVPSAAAASPSSPADADDKDTDAARASRADGEDGDQGEDGEEQGQDEDEEADLPPTPREATFELSIRTPCTPSRCQHSTLNP